MLLLSQDFFIFPNVLLSLKYLYIRSTFTAIQGSGWGWLGYNTTTGRLEVATCANQDPLHATTGLIPIFGLDMWEHA